MSLSVPHIEHGGNHVSGIPYAKHCFVCCEEYFLSEWVVGLDKPHMVVIVGFSCETHVLQGVVQTVIEVTI